jgi:hypothetical protein
VVATVTGRDEDVDDEGVGFADFSEAFATEGFALSELPVEAVEVGLALSVEVAVLLATDDRALSEVTVEAVVIDLAFSLFLSWVVDVRSAIVSVVFFVVLDGAGAGSG